MRRMKLKFKGAVLSYTEDDLRPMIWQQLIMLMLVVKFPKWLPSVIYVCTIYDVNASS